MTLVLPGVFWDLTNSEDSQASCDLDVHLTDGYPVRYTPGAILWSSRKNLERFPTLTIYAQLVCISYNQMQPFMHNCCAYRTVRCIMGRDTQSGKSKCVINLPIKLETCLTFLSIRVPPPFDPHGRVTEPSAALSVRSPSALRMCLSLICAIHLL